MAQRIRRVTTNHKIVGSNPIGDKIGSYILPELSLFDPTTIIFLMLNTSSRKYLSHLAKRSYGVTGYHFGL